MTTCDILLAHLCPLNNSFSLSPHARLSYPLDSSRPPFLLSPSFRPFLLVPVFIPCFLSRFTLRSASAPSFASPDKEIARGEGTASEGSQRQLSKSCETGLDVYTYSHNLHLSRRELQEPFAIYRAVIRTAGSTKSQSVS